jgi:hypothetical protein
MISIHNRMKPHTNDAVARMQSIRNAMPGMSSVGSTQYVEGRIVQSMSPVSALGDLSLSSDQDLTGPVEVDAVGEPLHPAAEENMLN